MQQPPDLWGDVSTLTCIELYCVISAKPGLALDWTSAWQVH